MMLQWKNSSLGDDDKVNYRQFEDAGKRTLFIESNNNKFSLNDWTQMAEKWTLKIKRNM